MRNILHVEADIKGQRRVPAYTVTQNDSVSIVVTVLDGGSPVNLDEVSTMTIACTRRDGNVVVKAGTQTGPNEVTFDLGTSEIELTGKVDAVIQLYSADGRVSTIKFSFMVTKDPTGDGYVPSEDERTLIEVVLGDGPLTIERAETAAANAESAAEYIDEKKPLIDKFTDEQTSLQAQLDEVARGATNAETSQARVSTTGTAYGTLKQRLDTEYEEVTTQLAQKAQLEDLKRSLGHIPYGKLKTTEGFAPLPFNLIRKNDGKIYHDFDFEQYRNGEEIFISNDGSNSTGDGTREKPYLDMYYAVDEAMARPGNKFVIKCLSSHVIRGVRNRSINGKTIAIMPAEPNQRLFITAHESGLSWTQENGVWKATRSGVYSVFDLRIEDEYGVPIPLTNKETLAECEAEPGTWYTDNTTVWINTNDGLTPDDVNYAINRTQPYFEPMLLGDAQLYVEDVTFLQGGSTSGLRPQASVTGGVSGTFIMNKCKIAGGDLRTENANGTNGLTLINVKNTFLFDTICAYAGEDGFNYHYGSVVSEERRKCLVVEYNCTSYRHGKFSTRRTSNCSTAHEGICILRVNGVYFESTGPIVNDANGCLSVYYDCTAQDSLASNQIQRSAFRGDNDGASVKGRVCLINCNGGGIDTYSLYTGDDMEIILQSFRGYNIPETIDYQVLS